MKATNSSIVFLQWLILSFYFWIIYDYYSLYFDVQLNYVEGYVDSVPEDVLGFGFWVTWVPIFLIWIFLGIMTWKSDSKYRKNFFISSVIFILVSLIDFILFEILKKQVIT